MGEYGSKFIQIEKALIGIKEALQNASDNAYCASNDANRAASNSRTSIDKVSDLESEVKRLKKKMDKLQTIMTEMKNLPQLQYDTYKKALRSFESGDFVVAANLFDSLCGYRDSMERWQESLEKAYQYAQDLLGSGAVENLESAKRTLKALVGYRDSEALAERADEMILDARYQRAVGLLGSDSMDDVKLAEEELEALSGYRDSEALAEGARKRRHEAGVYCIGEKLVFGHWGGEPIEWRVLDASGGRALLVSEKAIDCKPYNKSGVEVTWADCSLRRWLNGPFLQGAFDAADRASIAQVTVSNPDNARRRTRGGADTQDSVFCLSVDEAERYFKDDEDRMAWPTDKARCMTAYYGFGDGFDWWLRSPGFSQTRAALIDATGSIGEFGSDVCTGAVGVRPALYLNL